MADLFRRQDATEGDIMHIEGLIPPMGELKEEKILLGADLLDNKEANHFFETDGTPTNNGGPMEGDSGPRYGRATWDFPPPEGEEAREVTEDELLRHLERPTAFCSMFMSVSLLGCLLMILTIYKNP